MKKIIHLSLLKYNLFFKLNSNRKPKLYTNQENHERNTSILRYFIYNHILNLNLIKRKCTGKASEKTVNTVFVLKYFIKYRQITKDTCNIINKLYQRKRRFLFFGRNYNKKKKHVFLLEISKFN